MQNFVTCLTACCNRFEAGCFARGELGYSRIQGSAVSENELHRAVKPRNKKIKQEKQQEFEKSSFEVEIGD